MSGGMGTLCASRVFKGMLPKEFYGLPKYFVRSSQNQFQNV